MAEGRGGGSSIADFVVVGRVGDAIRYVIGGIQCIIGWILNIIREIGCVIEGIWS